MSLKVLLENEVLLEQKPYGANWCKIGASNCPKICPPDFTEYVANKRINKRNYVRIATFLRQSLGNKNCCK